MGGRSCQRESLGMCLANPLTNQIGRCFFTDKFTLNNVCYIVNLQLVHSFPPKSTWWIFPNYGGRYSTGTGCGGLCNPGQSECRHGNTVPFLAERHRAFPALKPRGRADRSRAAEIGGFCGMRRVGRKIFLVFIGLHLRVQLFLSFGVWMKGRLLWNANA